MPLYTYFDYYVTYFKNRFLAYSFYIECIKYISIIFICIIFLVCLYIRFKYRFWCMQPVFHIYDFHYYIFPPGIIRHELPEKNKYCNFKNIETIEFSMIEDYKIAKFANFVQSHYLRNKENIYLPEKANIVPYFSGRQFGFLFFILYRAGTVIRYQDEFFHRRHSNCCGDH